MLEIAFTAVQIKWRMLAKTVLHFLLWGRKIKQSSKFVAVQLRFPRGKYTFEERNCKEQRFEWKHILEAFAQNLFLGRTIGLQGNVNHIYYDFYPYSAQLI